MVCQVTASASQPRLHIRGTCKAKTPPNASVQTSMRTMVGWWGGGCQVSLAGLDYISQNSLSCSFLIGMGHKRNSWEFQRTEGQQQPLLNTHIVLICQPGLQLLRLLLHPCSASPLPGQVCVFSSRANSQDICTHQDQRQQQVTWGSYYLQYFNDFTLGLGGLIIKYVSLFSLRGKLEI